MNIEQSKRLSVGQEVYWGAIEEERGIVTNVTDTHVYIRWDNETTGCCAHNRMLHIYLKPAVTV